MLFAACEHPYDTHRTYYYDAVLEGYVYDINTQQPIDSVTVSATSSASGSGFIWGWSVSEKEECFTDNSGYYKIQRVISHFDGHDATYVYLSVWKNNEYSYKEITLTDILKKQTGIIRLDTIWVYKLH